jgi:hypothetical protein
MAHTTKSLYSLHPAFAMEEGSEKRLLERTGKSLHQWIKILKRDGPTDEREQSNWLMQQHDFTTNYAMWVVERASGKGGAENYDPGSIVEEMYAGAKSALRPIYEKLLMLGLSLGDDVKACPCKTFVPLYRKHVFAQIKPTTRTRIDLGLALRDTPVDGRLIDTGGFAKKDRITHRIAIASVDEIDGFVKSWMKRAYGMP